MGEAPTGVARTIWRVVVREYAISIECICSVPDNIEGAEVSTEGAFGKGGAVWGEGGGEWAVVRGRGRRVRVSVFARARTWSPHHLKEGLASRSHVQMGEATSQVREVTSQRAGERT